MGLSHVDGQIAGRDYCVVKPHIVHAQDKKKAYPKIIVDGLNKTNGEGIRFRSLDNAERHIRNMGLSLSRD